MKKQTPPSKVTKLAPRPPPSKPPSKAPAPISAAIDEDDLPPLIPPELPAAELPVQPILVDPSPRAAVAPAGAPTPPAKQPVLKNDKGICRFGLPCAWSVTGCPPDTNP